MASWYSATHALPCILRRLLPSLYIFSLALLSLFVDAKLIFPQNGPLDILITFTFLFNILPFYLFIERIFDLILLLLHTPERHWPLADIDYSITPHHVPFHLEVATRTSLQYTHPALALKLVNAVCFSFGHLISHVIRGCNAVSQMLAHKVIGFLRRKYCHF